MGHGQGLEKESACRKVIDDSVTLHGQHANSQPISLLATMAREPASPSQVLPLSREFGDSGAVVAKIQHIAIFDTRAPASAIPQICDLHQLRLHSNQIFLG
jgi:hypothetical protein